MFSKLLSLILVYLACSLAQCSIVIEVRSDSEDTSIPCSIKTRCSEKNNTTPNYIYGFYKNRRKHSILL